MSFKQAFRQTRESIVGGPAARTTRDSMPGGGDAAHIAVDATGAVHTTALPPTGKRRR